MAAFLELERILGECQERNDVEFVPKSQFLEGMSTFVGALSRDQYSGLGRRLLIEELRRVADERLRLEQKFRATSDSVDHEYTVISGLPRTGSTALHAALCSLPNVVGVTTQMGLYPSRAYPDGLSGEVEAASNFYMTALSRRSPRLLAIHPMDLRAPEECILPMMVTGVSYRLAILTDAPQYLEWLASNADHVLAYTEYRAILGLLWSSPRRVVLKAPTHALQVEAFRAVFPQCERLWLTRSLTEVLPSFYGLVEACRQIFADGVDRRSISEQWGPLWSGVADTPADGWDVVEYGEVLQRLRGFAQHNRVPEWLKPNPHRYRLEDF